MCLGPLNDVDRFNELPFLRWSGKSSRIWWAEVQHPYTPEHSVESDRVFMAALLLDTSKGYEESYPLCQDTDGNDRCWVVVLSGGDMQDCRFHLQKILNSDRFWGVWWVAQGM